MDSPVREAAPFLVGMMLPPFLMLIMSPAWSKMGKFIASFVPALLVGGTISILAGEIIGRDLPEALAALIVDTALVYTGSQLAYRLAWKGLLEERMRQWRGASALHTREIGK